MWSRLVQRKKAPNAMHSALFILAEAVTLRDHTAIVRESA
jgi:hypothetical protein